MYYAYDIRSRDVAVPVVAPTDMRAHGRYHPSTDVLGRGPASVGARSFLPQIIGELRVPQRCHALMDRPTAVVTKKIQDSLTKAFVC